MSGTYTVQDFGPADLLTSSYEGFRRVRVDLAQTGFFLGHQGRVHKELNIPTGQSITFKATSALNTIILGNSVSIDSGSLRICIYIGGTVAGSPTETLTPVLQNFMTSRKMPYYTLQNTVQAYAGSVTGGQLVDTARLVAANASAQASTVGGSQDDSRGVSPGEYHYEFTNIGNSAVTGVWRYLWEERPDTY